MISNLGLNNTLKLFINRLFSINHYYVMKRKLNFLDKKKIRIAYRIENLHNINFSYLIKSLKSLDSESRRELMARISFYNAGFKNCYVAKTKNEEIAFIQWLIHPSENLIIKEHFSNKFYMLGERQVMIENAFTFPKFRGHGLLPAVTSDLLEIAEKAGYENVITYIRKDRIASINEFMKLDFKITKLLTEYRVMGITRRTL